MRPPLLLPLVAFLLLTLFAAHLRASPATPSPQLKTQNQPAPTPRPRPTEWATPIINSSLENCFRVSNDLYRCEQPTDRHIADLRALGIKSILNLRRYNTDPVTLELAGFKLLLQRMEADDLTLDDLVKALRLLRDAPKPVLIHCWHGSDRTGSVVAAYRVAFQNWTPEAALDEFRHGGFGYHERWFPNLLTLLRSIDAADLRQRVQAP